MHPSCCLELNSCEQTPDLQGVVRDATDVGGECLAGHCHPRFQTCMCCMQDAAVWEKYLLGLLGIGISG